MVECGPSTVRRECRVERSRVACRLSRVVAGAPVSTPRIGYDFNYYCEDAFGYHARSKLLDGLRFVFVL